jgi:hypothetical protein
MRFNELRWCHLAIVLQRVERGDLAGDAAQVAGLTVPIWARVRKLWDEVPGHLAKVDPEGIPVDLEQLNELIYANRKNGGRPQGSRDLEPRARRTKQAELADLVVKSDLVYVEDGIFYDD